jgi:flagellar FliL protein
MAEPASDKNAGGQGGPGAGGLVILLLVLTVLAGGVGFAMGGLVLGRDAGPSAVAGTESGDDAQAGSGEGGQAASGTKDGGDDENKTASHGALQGTIIDLEPVVTNLADPPNTWVRLEAAIRIAPDYEGDKQLLQREISEDLLVFMREVSLRHVDGAAGLSHFKQDITERARTRSQGAVSELLLKMLVVE